MFKKQTCKGCKEKISKKFDYCPYCGAPTNSSKNKDWGMLGKNDIEDEFDSLSNQMFGGLSGKMFNKMLGGAMKMLEKELQKSMNQEPSLKTNFELYVNGKKISPENIKITQKPAQEKPAEVKISKNIFSKEATKKFLELPKKEPSTNIRRLSNKVIYEIDVPGVNSIKDISIIQLENSIEIKAVSKDKAYKKIIPIDLPLKGYKLDNGKIVLELEFKS
jgi:hypothetical protein